MAAVVVVLALFLIVLALALFNARHDIDEGTADVRTTKADVAALTTSTAPQAVLHHAGVSLSHAHSAFGAADSWLQPFAPLLRHLSWLPRVGPDVAASPDAASLANQMTEGGMLLLRGINPVIAVMSHDRAGSTRISAVARRLAVSRPLFRQACTHFDAAAETRRSLNGSSSVRLRNVLSTFDRELPRLSTLCRALPLLPGLLGVDRPRSYLIAYQNPDELRATGGFIGSVALLQARDGVIRESYGSSGTARDNLSIPPPDPILLYNREPGWLFRDSNWSPDFPTSAALERFFAALDLHLHADGVINVTPAAASDMLNATGPIYAPEYRRWVTAANVARLADYYAHWSTNPGPLHYANGDAQRKQFIGIVAGHIFSRLQTLPAARWISVGTNVAGAITHGDIQMAFDSAADEGLARLAGADGAVAASPSDYLYVVDSNLSYNKINPYVHTRIAYRATIEGTRWVQATLTLTMTNVPAPQPVAGYGQGPGAGTLGGPDDYADFVRVYVPPGAQLLHQSGWTQPWSGGEAYGKMMFCGYIIVRRGQTRQIRLTYLMPPNLFTRSHGSRYALLVPHQPGSHPDVMSVNVSDGATHRSWTVAHPDTTWSGSMAIQQRPFTPIPLPSGEKTDVAPGHWIEPHAFLGRPQPNG